MSRHALRETERTVNTILLCGMGGLLVGLVGATVLVYTGSEPDANHASPQKDTTQGAQLGSIQPAKER